MSSNISGGIAARRLSVKKFGMFMKGYGEVCDDEKSRVATPAPIAPIERPSMVMNVADALPLVILMSTPAKYTTDPAGSVLPASAYWGRPSTNTLIHTSSVTRTPSTIGRVCGVGEGPGVPPGLIAAKCAAAVGAPGRWSDCICRHA